MANTSSITDANVSSTVINIARTALKIKSNHESIKVINFNSLDTHLTDYPDIIDDICKNYPQYYAQYGISDLTIDPKQIRLRYLPKQQYLIICTNNLINNTVLDEIQATDAKPKQFLHITPKNTKWWFIGAIISVLLSYVPMLVYKLTIATISINIVVMLIAIAIVMLLNYYAKRFDGGPDTKIYNHKLKKTIMKINHIYERHNKLANDSYFN